MKKHFLIYLSALVTFLYGCGGSQENNKVDKVKIFKGNHQCVLPGEECSKELIIELLGPQRKGLLGGKGSRSPVAGAKVEFKCLPGSELTFNPPVATSGNGGTIRTKITAGTKIGDQYFEAIPVDFPEKKCLIRIVNGVQLTGLDQETFSGESLPEPIKLKLVDGTGSPIEGAKVFFNISSSPEKKKIKASIKPKETFTNKDGEAECKMKIGTSTGTYCIAAEIVDPVRNLHFRAIEIKELGLNLKGLIFTVLGGLAIFIFGMKMMSEGLQLVAGENLKSVLQYFTRNRIMAIMAGALVTGVIQSSSACTVMVVGFVNAGLLTLTQAIGTIFGANIGTTITAQMISFKLTGLAFPAIIVGLIITMAVKKVKFKGWGHTILGFGLLFYGMSLMGNELKLIGQFPSFKEFFQYFNCTPVDGHMPVSAVLATIGIGTVMTVLIQSSSATIGIALALAMGGLIDFYTAVPLILGDNIGTTVTAGLASIGANKPSKQTALAHFLFNFLGTCFMFLLFFVNMPGTEIPIYLYFINEITAGDVFAVVPENITRHIAMAHTMFNVGNVIIFLPFIGVIAKICNWVIKIEEDESIKLTLLEPHLLNTPAIAIEQSIFAIRRMTKDSWKMIESAMNKSFMISKVDEKLESKLAEKEDKIDQMQIDLTEYLSKITQQVLTESQSDIIPLLMHCTNDAERVADHTENILKLTSRLQKAKKPFSEEAKGELLKMWKILSDQAEHVISCVQKTDQEEVISALEDERKINKLASKLEKSHIKRLKKKKCDVVNGVIFIEIVAELEKIADHLTNIAERAPEIQRHHLNLKGKEAS